MTPETADSLREEKQRLRREIRNAAASLEADYRAAASRRIAERVRALASYREARTVMMYVSLPAEPDTRELIADAVSAGKTVLLPRCTGPEEMIALPFTGWDRLEKGRLNIPEPPVPAGKTEIPDPDVILVPCVTVSPDGRRLGHGAGYYDRFLAGRRGETICLCFRRLTRRDVPAGPTDRRMDRVITD